MPTYEYRCLACGQRFEHFYRSMAQADAAGYPPCPFCANVQTERVPSSFAVSGPPSADPGEVAHERAQAERAASITPRDQIERWRKAKQRT